MSRGWRSGFGLGRDWVWVAPIVSLALVVVGLATNTDGDLRRGLFLRLMAAAAVGVGASVLLGVFAGSWVMIGLSVRPGKLAVIREARG